MGKFTNRALYALGHYSRKLKCNRAIFKILSPFFCSCDRPIVKPLEEFWPDRGTSCIRHNNVYEYPTYDLQIVVPCYNVEQFVEECVESIISQQTHYLFKVVLVNDGSTDGTLNILRRYEELENVTVINQKNRGFGGARNAGYSEIDAKYLMFVDSDDILSEGAVEVLLSKAYELRADIVEGGFERFTEKKVMYSQVHPDADDNRAISGFPWGKVYKSSLFENLVFPEGYWYEDTFCYMILHYYAKHIATISNVVYRWRKNTSSITFTSKRNLRSIDSFWVTKHLIEDRLSLGLPFDEEFCKFFLHQVRINFQRTASMGENQIDRSIFTETIKLWHLYFSRFPALVVDSKLAKSLSNSYYLQYKLECLFG